MPFHLSATTGTLLLIRRTCSSLFSKWAIGMSWGLSISAFHYIFPHNLSHSLSLWALLICPTLVSAAAEEEREDADMLTCHCKSSQQSHCIEATAQPMNTRLHHKLLKIFFPKLWCPVSTQMDDGVWGREGYFKELLELMQVYLARHPADAVKASEVK